MALADTAMVIAILAANRGFRPMTTVDQTTHFMRAVTSSDVLADALDCPVTDRTGLNGFFEIDLNWTPAENPAVSGPSIASAVQEDLGLKLEPAKGPGEFLVIDHVERPSEN